MHQCHVSFVMCMQTCNPFITRTPMTKVKNNGLSNYHRTYSELAGNLMLKKLSKFSEIIGSCNYRIPIYSAPLLDRQ